MVILNFVEKYFKNFLDNIPLVKVNVPTVEKKRLFQTLPHLGVTSLQTRT